MEGLPLDPMTQALVDALKSAYEQGGYLALVGTALMLSVRAVRLFEPLEEKWVQLSKSAQRAAVFGTSALGAVIVAVSTGAPISMAIPGAILTGLIATVLHKSSQAVGAAVKLTGNPKIDALLKLGLGDKLQEPPQ